MLVLSHVASALIKNPQAAERRAKKEHQNRVLPSKVALAGVRLISHPSTSKEARNKCKTRTSLWHIHNNRDFKKPEPE